LQKKLGWNLLRNKTAQNMHTFAAEIKKKFSLFGTIIINNQKILKMEKILMILLEMAQALFDLFDNMDK